MSDPKECPACGHDLSEPVPPIAPQFWADALRGIHPEWAYIYAGKQVAIHRTQGVVASGKTLGEVLDQLDKLNINLDLDDLAFDGFEGK